MPDRRCVSTLASVLAAGLAASIAAADITIPTVVVGYPGNAPDPATGIFGAVPYTYRIGTTEVTNAQYAAFLNAKAASDPNGLYDPAMASAYGGITRSGAPGSYRYQTIAGRENHPVNTVSFWDACRFANWLHNGQGSGSTETGAYTLTPSSISNNSVFRNPGWRWAVTGEDEWYKAAYYQPAQRGGDRDNYWLFPTSRNSLNLSDANFGNLAGNTSRVGSYAPNFFGTFDMAGNVFEWNEAAFSVEDVEGIVRGTRGGSFYTIPQFLRSDERGWFFSTDESSIIGFRVSAAICRADFNADGFVDFFDFDDFVAAFDSGNRSADVNNDGFIDFFDFDFFVDAFERGC